MENTKGTFYITKKLCATNKTTTLFLPNFLGIEVGDIVRLTCIEYGNPKHRSMVIKRVCKLGGNGFGCYLDKSLGFKKDDIISVRVEYIGKARAETDDTRVEIEKGFEEDFD